MTPEEIIASWDSQIPGGIPEEVKQYVAFNFPQFQNVILHPITWAMSGTNFKATLTGMLNSTTIIILTPAGILVEQDEMMAQEYFPDKIKNCIKKLHPEWTGEGVYSSPVISAWCVKKTGGQPIVHWWDDTYTEDWQITFDDPSITMEKIASMDEYKQSIILCDKYGNLK